MAGTILISCSCRRLTVKTKIPSTLRVLVLTGISLRCSTINLCICYLCYTQIIRDNLYVYRDYLLMIDAISAILIKYGKIYNLCEV